MRRALVAFTSIMVLSFAVALTTAGGGDSPRPASRSTPPPVARSGPDPSTGFARALTFVEYVRTVDADTVGTYLAGVAVAEYVASIPPPVPVMTYISPTPTPTNNTAITGACGGATNGADQFIARESGGNPGVWNTGGSGAWGCYQIMPGTWAGAGCDELGAHGSASPAAQAACASRLSLSAWGG